jgi:hypothetical protein
MATCAHCDSTQPHEHLDVSAAVRERRRALALSAGAHVLVVAALAGSLAALTAVPTTPPVVVVALAGTAAWAVATATGVLAAGFAHRTDGGRRRRGASASLVIGALVTGAVTPLTALAVALLVPPSDAAGPLAVAGWAGLGWLGAASAAEIAGAVRLRGLLLRPGPAGERARADAVRDARPGTSRPDGGFRRDVRAIGGVLLAALVFTAWTVTLMLVPAAVVVLVPLHVAGVALVARARIPSRAGASTATLRG